MSCEEVSCEEVSCEEVSCEETAADETSSDCTDEVISDDTSETICEETISDSTERTVTLNEAVYCPSTEQAVITALPGFKALMTQLSPLPSTDTIPALLDDHVQSWLLAEDGVKSGVTFSESPTFIDLSLKPNDSPATGTLLVAGSTY